MIGFTTHVYNYIPCAQRRKKNDGKIKFDK